MPDSIITATDIHKTYATGTVKVDAMRGVDLNVERGEMVAIMGPSGSGKSTLFNMIGALDRPTSGEVKVAGLDLTKLSRRQLAYFRGNHIGYIFQSYNLIASYTAEDNVAVPLLLSGAAVKSALERARDVLSRVGLGHRLVHRPDQLSGGQQQRVAIALALVNDPAIILADEPTGNLDLQTGEEIISLLHELSKQDGITVISATHDHKMLDVSDRIVWVADGRVDRVEKRKDVEIEVGKVVE